MFIELTGDQVAARAAGTSNGDASAQPATNAAQSPEMRGQVRFGGCFEELTTDAVVGVSSAMSPHRREREKVRARQSERQVEDAKDGPRGGVAEDRSHEPMGSSPRISGVYPAKLVVLTPKQGGPREGSR
jgi:hypothetical protein